MTFVSRIPSEGKQKGWENFLKIAPALAEKGLSSKRELPLIHRIVTAQTPLPKRSDQDVISSMAHLVADRNPYIRTPEQRSGIKGEVREYFNESQRTQTEIIGREHGVQFEDPQASRVWGVRFTVSPYIRGHYRQYGKRRLNESPVETIDEPGASPVRLLKNGMIVKEGLFVNVAEKLQPLMDELCARYDHEFTKAKSLEDKLSSSVYLYLWGLGIIHPFGDANRRTFEAKMMVDLRKMGFAVKDLPALPEVLPQLEGNAILGIGPGFLSEFLKKENIPLIPKEDVSAFMANSVQYLKYMRELHAKIASRIREGFSKKSLIAPYIEAGVNTLKLCLSRDGFIERSFYERNINAFIEGHKHLRDVQSI